MWIDDVLLCFRKIFDCEITFSESRAHLALARFVEILVLWGCQQFRQRREIQERINELVNLFLIGARDVVVNRALGGIPVHFTSGVALAVGHVETRQRRIAIYRPVPSCAAFRLGSSFIARLFL